MKKKISVAIDGPSAAGKSTIAKMVAKKENFIYIDTGAMYRSVAFYCIKNHIDLNDEQAVEQAISNIQIRLTADNKVYLNDEDVSLQIRTDEVSLGASCVSKYQAVRTFLVDEQRKMAETGNVILDGRDIGTVVLPHADLKIYQIASVETRAKRRYLENKERGLEADLETIKKEIEQRDYQDMHRAISPLKKVDDAIELDTSNMTLEEVVDQQGRNNMAGVVAIVGRANVGKSTIFNRMVGERISIVEDVAGVTRDRIYAKASWLTKEFSVIDTGGIELENASFTTQIKMQAEIAIEEADVIVFVVNGREGITKEDEYVARLLQKSRKPIILVVNKIDDNQFRDYIYEFYALGVGDPIPVSGSHGIGIGDLLDQIINQLDLQDEETSEDEISFSIIGRPNVGKSSLTNAILGEERVIVSNIEGTTRDAIDTPFVKDGQKYRVVDTAGMRKKGKVYENIEKYSILRALTSIEKSDVILVVIDGETGIREQDKHVAGYAHEAGKGVVIVYNKWDLVDKDEKTMQKKQKEIYEQFKYLDYARIVFTSAKTGQRVDQIFPLIQESYENSRKRVQTSVLNDVLVDAQLMNPTTTFNGGRLKIFYANQVAVCPPTFVLFSNDPQYLHFSYKRYLENRLREAFGFEGTPIHIICRKRD